MGVRDDILAIPDELLRTGEVTEVALVFMDFKDNPKRWWNGIGPFTHAGHEWQGVGDLISMSEIRASYQPTAEPMTFELAATEQMIDDTIDAQAQVYGRAVYVYGQLMYTSPALGRDAWTPIGSPYAHFVGTMRSPSYSFSATQGKITLGAEGLFYRRSSPPRGILNDTDQKSRQPGDRGAEYFPKYEDYETRWV